MGSTIMDPDKKNTQPFIDSCVDAGTARIACEDLFGQLRGINDYLEQGKKYLGDEAETGDFKKAIVESVGDLDKVGRIIKKIKGKSKSFVCDVTDADTFKSILKKINRLDILVNNAGNNRPEHFTKVKKVNMEYLTNLNMKAVFNIAQLCSQKMIKFKNRKNIGGSIIHMSSQLGKVGCEGRNVYNMNKFGVEGLARGMACE